MSDEKKIMKTLNGYTVYDEEAHRRIDSLAGSAPGLVFDTVADMEAYVAEHHAELKVGQNLYIREVDVPDYWWDGTAVQELETKVNLSGYAKQEEVERLSEAIEDLQNKTNVNSTGWTAGQIALLNQLFDCIPWTNAGAGAIADSLIASLTSNSSPDDDNGNETEDNITQSGSTLTIIALKTAPTQTGNILTVA